MYFNIKNSDRITIIKKMLIINNTITCVYISKQKKLLRRQPRLQMYMTTIGKKISLFVFSISSINYHLQSMDSMIRHVDISYCSNRFHNPHRTSSTGILNHVILSYFIPFFQCLLITIKFLFFFFII